MSIIKNVKASPKAIKAREEAEDNAEAENITKEAEKVAAALGLTVPSDAKEKALKKVKDDKGKHKKQKKKRKKGKAGP